MKQLTEEEKIKKLVARLYYWDACEEMNRIVARCKTLEEVRKRVGKDLVWIWQRLPVAYLATKLSDKALIAKISCEDCQDMFTKNNIEYDLLCASTYLEVDDYYSNIPAEELYTQFMKARKKKLNYL